jgi:hypothetical protein
MYLGHFLGDFCCVFPWISAYLKSALTPPFMRRADGAPGLTAGDFQA